MSLTAAVRVAVVALLLKKGQSALTTLGIVIGVSSVIAVTAAGAGARSKLDDSLDSIGKTVVLVRPGARTNQGNMGSFEPLTAADVEAARRRAAPWVVGVAPSQMTQRPVASRYATAASWLAGSTPAVVAIRKWDVTHGRFYTDDEVRQAAPVCLLGQTTLRRLFPQLPNPVGEYVTVEHVRLRVIGVLGAKGRTPTGGDQDDQVSVPISTLQRTLGAGERLSMILAAARSPAVLGRARDEIAAAVRESHHLPPGAPDDFDASTVREMARLAEVVTGTLQIVVVVIASISLLVGGVGITNIMLVSVTQRTREIGLRLAVGARPRDILRQFLIEAVVLALAGGVLGITLGLAGTVALARLARWPVVIPQGGLALTFLVSAGVGVFFGFYPAWRASRLEPVRALRAE